MNNILGSDMATLSRITNARSRSICAENPTGEKGKGGMATTGTGANCARDLGQGWKISPSVRIDPHTTYTMADIQGSGAIQHIWLTPAGIPTRYAVLRIYWDGSDVPSVECPLGDFFANELLLGDAFPQRMPDHSGKSGG